MHHGSSDSKGLANFIYKLEQVQHMQSQETSFQHEISSYGMLLMKEAAGWLVINGQRHTLHPQKIFIISPGAVAAMHISPGDEASYYYIRFLALHTEDGEHYKPIKLNCPCECNTAYFHMLVDMVQEIEKKQRSGNNWDAMKANIMFQEMIVTLFQDTVHEQKADHNSAIQLTLHYMEKNYRSDITREKLAELAGLSADYYSRVFKKVVQKSPMEALTEIRLNRAKQLLIQSNASYRSIAYSVGFSDEFYFSRKFKKEIGCSPKSYVKQMKYSTKIASLNHLTTGHLLALNIEPYAAVINDAFPVTAGLRNTIGVGFFNPDLEKLLDAKPDIIVAHGSRDEEKSQKEKLFNQIAPTITLHFLENWRVHFKTIATIVGKEKEAAGWLEQYEGKAEKIRNRVQSKIGDETCLLVGIGEGKMCVYGQRNMGTVLYGDLKLPVPKGVQDIVHYKEISIEDLDGFDADRILVTSFRHDGSAHTDRVIRKKVSALCSNPLWSSLKAVRNQKVYWMYDSRHLYTSYNALSHDLFLDKVNQLLLSENR